MVQQAKTKKCNKCGELLLLSCFYKRKDNKSLNSVRHICKECSKEKHKIKMKSSTYREKMIENSKKWQTENPLKTRYLIAKSSSLNKNRRTVRQFNISFDEIVCLWRKGCHYCGTNILSNKGVGLDRIDNSKDYTLDNVLPCCGDCNKMRNTVLSVEEMEVAMKAVLSFRKSLV